MILDGKKVRDELLEKIRNEIAQRNLNLTLAIILVGSYEPSEVYVRNKIKACEKVGIHTKLIRLLESTEEEVINVIKNLNEDKSITGIILQSPVPDNINIEIVLELSILRRMSMALRKRISMGLVTEWNVFIRALQRGLFIF